MTSPVPIAAKAAASSGTIGKSQLLAYDLKMNHQLAANATPEEIRAECEFRWQTGGLYCLVFVACNVVLMPLLIGQVRGHLVESFRIPSQSMEPSVLMGDVLFADKRYNCPGCGLPVARGDIAIFTYPNDRTLRYIKRIIGLPGDRVQIRGQEVFVNGVSLVAERQGADRAIITEHLGQRQWQVSWAATPEASAQRTPNPPDLDLLVAPGMVFVLGDRLVFDYNLFATHYKAVSDRPVPAGASTVAVQFEKLNSANSLLEVEGMSPAT